MSDASVRWNFGFAGFLHYINIPWVSLWLSLTVTSGYYDKEIQMSSVPPLLMSTPNWLNHFQYCQWVSTWH